MHSHHSGVHHGWRIHAVATAEGMHHHHHHHLLILLLESTVLTALPFALCGTLFALGGSLLLLVLHVLGKGWLVVGGTASTAEGA